MIKSPSNIIATTGTCLHEDLVSKIYYLTHRGQECLGDWLCTCNALVGHNRINSRSSIELNSFNSAVSFSEKWKVK